jgi:hypothetical protein
MRGPTPGDALSLNVNWTNLWLSGGGSEVSRKLDFGRLLGFDTLSGSKSGNVDFQDETVSAKLGSKRGEPAGRTRSQVSHRDETEPRPGAISAR